MENPIDLLVQIGLFLWVVLKLAIYALAGGALMGLLDLVARLTKTQATRRDYLLALGFSFLVGIFIEWSSTTKIVEDLKNENATFDGNLKQLRIDFATQTSELTKAHANVNQTQTALAQAQKDNADLKGSKEDLSLKLRILEATTFPQLQMTGTPKLEPTTGTHTVLVVPIINSGKVPAKVESTNVYIFINGKLHFRAPNPNKPFNFMPGVARVLVDEFDGISIDDVHAGILKMWFVIEIKYRGALNDQHSFCGKGEYHPEIKSYRYQSIYDQKCDMGLIS